MSLFRVLHLSDIHIGKTYKPSEDIAYKIISDIEHNGLCPINIVAVTGDIFDGQIETNDRLISEAVKFFEILLEQINYIQSDNVIAKKDFIFVPGNHDLIRVDDENERWSKYRKFLIGFYGYIPEWYDKNNFSVFLPYHHSKIVFVGFNSCQIEKKRIFDSKYIDTLKKHIDSDKLAKHGFDKKTLINVLENEVVNEYDDYGNISMSQIFNVERKVKTLDDYNVIALFHHHFYLFPEVAKEFGDSSLVRNYTEEILKVSDVENGRNSISVKYDDLYKFMYSADNKHKLGRD